MKTLLLALVALVVWAVPAHAAPTLRKGPVPAWVDAMSVARDPVPPASAAGVYYALIDRQVRHRGGDAAWYAHFADMALSTEGVGQISRVAFQFEPSYQTVTLHRLRVIRDGKARDVLDPSAFQIVAVESDTHARMYRGLVEASFEIPDIRVGDIVEVAYTIRGRNPVYGDAILDDWAIAFSQPVGELGYRLLAPASVDLAVDAVQTDRELVRSRRGDQQELRYRARDVPAHDFDSERPGWFDAQPRFRISSFADWRAVANWALPLYNKAAQADDAVRELAGELRKKHATPLARARAAARFVQDEIRYVSILVGPHTHEPHPAPRVLEQRYGDCKDKSTLLAVLLTELDIPAQPALVSSYRGRGLDSWLATPWAFNHVIVRALIDGRETWIDPTLSQVRGDQLEPPDYERALVVSSTTDELARIERPEPLLPLLSVEERFEAPTTDAGEARLTVTSIFRGTEANAYRQRLASQSPEELGRDYLNYYTRRYPKISIDQPIEVEDDPRANAITVRESYVIPDFYGEGSERFALAEITGSLAKPSDLQRTEPWGLAHPTWTRQEIQITVGRGFDNRIEPTEIDNDFFRFTARADLEQGALVIRADLRTKTDAVPADRIGDYVAAVEEVNESSDFELDPPGAGLSWATADIGEAKTGLFFIGGLLLAVVLFIVLYNRGSRRGIATATTAPAPIGPPPAAPPPQSYPLEPRGNGLALTSMILGFVGLGLVIVPGVNLILGLLALIFGGLGIGRAKQLDGEGHGQASAGLVLGVFDILFSGLIIANLLS